MILVPPAPIDSIGPRKHRNFNVKNITRHKVPSFELPRTWLCPASPSAETLPYVLHNSHLPNGFNRCLLVQYVLSGPLQWDWYQRWFSSLLFSPCSPPSLPGRGTSSEVALTLCFTLHFLSRCLFKWYIHSLGEMDILQGISVSSNFISSIVVWVDGASVVVQITCSRCFCGITKWPEASPWVSWGLLEHIPSHLLSFTCSALVCWFWRWTLTLVEKLTSNLLSSTGWPQTSSPCLILQNVGDASIRQHI